MSRIRQTLPSAAIAALAGAVFAGSAAPALACPAFPMLGNVCWIGANYCPQGFIPADGRSLQIKDNEALFSLYGTRYGGDGVNDFGIPNLIGRVPVGVGQGPSPQVVTAVALGQKRGMEVVRLTEAQLPPHTHTATLSDTKGGSVTVTPQLNVVGDNTSATATVPGSGAPAATYIAGSPAAARQLPKMWAASATSPFNAGGFKIALNPANTTAGTIVNQPAGGGGEISILPPQLGLTACVATQGDYPARPD